MSYRIIYFEGKLICSLFLFRFYHRQVFPPTRIEFSFDGQT